MRTKYIELPTIEELDEILATESQRPIPPEKKDEHYVSLQPFITFLNGLTVNTSEITLDKTWQEVRMISEKIINEATIKILESDPKSIASLAEKVYSYLAEEDHPEKSDILIVPGAKTIARAEKAIELYNHEFAHKILFTGGVPLWEDRKIEAEKYMEFAIEAGIPEENIITEKKSITVADNIRSSLNLLDEINFNYKNIIIVNSPYTQRRGYSHLEKYTPLGTKIYRANAQTRIGLRKDDWFSNEEGILYVLTEYYKLWFGLVINTN